MNKQTIVNRDGVEFCFEKIEKNKILMSCSTPDKWITTRQGVQTSIDGVNEIVFIDPNGGPFIKVGDLMLGGKIKKIEKSDNQTYVLISDSK